MESIQGAVIKILKKNEVGHPVFMTIQYETVGGFVQAKLGGLAPSLKEGDWFSASGDWSENYYRGVKEHIFRSKLIKADLPSTVEGMRIFLQGIFNAQNHGITPDRISDALDKHGLDFLREAEKDPGRLVGLSTAPQRYEQAIKAEWQRRIQPFQAVSLMETSGVEKRAMDAILYAYHGEALSVLKKDPYQVARIPSVGFPNADKIGNTLGISSEDSRRISAALSDILYDLQSKGSTYAPFSIISEEIKKYQGLNLGVVSDFMISAIQEGNADISVTLVDDTPVIQLKPLLRAEVKVAREVARRLGGGRKNSRQKVNQVVGSVLAQEKYAKFDSIQRAGVYMGLTESVSILTGGPGTGKSTVMEAVAEAAEKLGETSIFLVAPTGQAAKRLRETSKRPTSTIHSLLRAQEDKRTGGSIFRVNRSNPLPRGSFVIIDETSIQGVETLAAILDALPEDGRLLLVGDENQLDSIEPGAVLRDLLAARINGRRLVPATILQNDYRSKNKAGISRGAREIKEGRVPKMDSKVRNGVVFFETPAEKITDMIKALVAGPIQNQLNFDPVRDVGILSPQAPGYAGTWEINRALGKELNKSGARIPGVFHGQNDDERLPLPRVGDRIVQTKNDFSNHVVNGDTGVITGVRNEMVNGKPRTLIDVEYDSLHPETGEPIRMSYPSALWRNLLMSYAGTVHKAQGSQYPVVIIPVTMEHQHMLDRTLLYTAWTRAQNMVMVVGETEALEWAVSRLKSEERHTRLQRFIEDCAKEWNIQPATDYVKNATANDNPPPPPPRMPMPVPQMPSATMRPRPF